MKSIYVQAVSASADEHTGKTLGWDANLLHKSKSATPPPVGYQYTGWQPGSNDLAVNDSLVAMVVDKNTPE